MPFDSGSDWTFSDIETAYEQIERVANDLFDLDIYRPQIEIISSEQMLDAYCITPDHKVLKSDLRWVEAGTIKEGDVILGFDEHGPHRAYRSATVLRVERAFEPVFAVTLTSSKQFRVTAEHGWLVRQQKGQTSSLVWRTTSQLRGSGHPTYEPSRIPKVMDMWDEADTKLTGWLAGMYDGEGNICRGSVQTLCISQNEGQTLDKLKSAISAHGYSFYEAKKPATSNCRSLGITGSSTDRLRFLGEVRPERLISKVSFDRIGMMKTPAYEEVVSVEPIGQREIVKITTSTGTFICDGYPMHNCSSGMPVYYSHWSFGKSLVAERDAYARGKMGLAYEIVINSNPCISYLMEDNSLAMQCLVIAHAAFGHNCFSDDTELLTKDGWKHRTQIVEGELIATLHPESRFIEYHPVIKKFEYDHNGDMCVVKNSASDHLVTSNHNMVYTSSTGKFKMTPADQWTATGTNAIVAGDAQLPTNEMYTDDEIRLLVWCITDGHLSYEPTNRWDFRLLKERKITRLRELLTSLNVEYTETVIESRQVTRFSARLPEKFVKLIPADFSLSKRQFNIMVLEWLETDGSRQAKHPTKNSGCLFTNVKRHADKIQELAVCSGATTAARIDRNGVYSISIRLEKEEVQLSRSPLAGKQHYEGKIWCVNVQNNTVVSRRNGKVLITGNSFFKNNVQFQQWTDADSIIDYLAYAKHFIMECEEKYGPREVEKLLDAAHALSMNSVDRYKRPPEQTKVQQEENKRANAQYEHEHFSDLWRTIPELADNATAEQKKALREAHAVEPEENLLYFVEHNAPQLKEWQRAILQIVRKIAQYFYPQMLTKVMNEGFATFVHYHTMQEMYARGLVTDGFMLEFLTSHTGVVRQAKFGQINPYALGFAMFQDIKRICQNPTEEDRRWFPTFAGAEDWVSVVKYAAFNFKDESFILQYLSPTVMRDLQLMHLRDDSAKPWLRVEAIHDDEGYRDLRERLAEQCNVNNRLPSIDVVGYNRWTDRELTLQYTSYNQQSLDTVTAIETTNHLADLWGYRVTLNTVEHESGKVVSSLSCTPENAHADSNRKTARVTTMS